MWAVESIPRMLSMDGDNAREGADSCSAGEVGEQIEYSAGFSDNRNTELGQYRARGKGR